MANLVCEDLFAHARASGMLLAYRLLGLIRFWQSARVIVTSSPTAVHGWFTVLLCGIRFQVHKPKTSIITGWTQCFYVVEPLYQYVYPSVNRIAFIIDRATQLIHHLRQHGKTLLVHRHHMYSVVHFSSLALQLPPIFTTFGLDNRCA